MTNYQLPPEELKQAADITDNDIENEKLFWLHLENEWFIGYFYNAYGGLNYRAASIDDMPKSIKGKGIGSVSKLIGYKDLIVPQTLTPTLDKALEALESVQWVDVKDRLPRAYETGNWDGKRSDFVLIKDSDEVILIARVYEGFMDGSHFEEWADEKEYELEVNKVTHWMPLPDTAKITEAINELKKLKG